MRPVQDIYKPKTLQVEAEPGEVCFSYRGIEANPEKLKDIFKMNSPTALKDVRKLTCCMEALSHFVS